MNLSERANAFSIAQLLESRQVGRNFFYNDYNYQSNGMENQMNGGLVSHKKLEEDLEGGYYWVIRNLKKSDFLETGHTQLENSGPLLLINVMLKEIHLIFICRVFPISFPKNYERKYSIYCIPVFTNIMF